MSEVLLKPDADRILARLDTLQASNWLTQKWWPKYTYHFAERLNAISILETGGLLCRESKPMKIDTASGQVLDRTDDKWKKHVRLYFRPRAPTQYQVEGFRPTGQFGSLGKHCPMPFIFMFDSADILTRKTTKFSDGNLAAQPIIGDNAAMFEQIPFDKVFHDGRMAESEKSLIKFHRCAEVLVPNNLDLSALRYVWCRSPAEYQTLFNCLSPEARQRYRKKFGVGAKADVHFRFWTFIEDVSLESAKIVLSFNPSTKTPGPFKANATITSHKYGKLSWSEDQFFTRQKFVLNISTFTTPVDYEFRFELDGDLAYLGRYKISDSGVIGTHK